MRACEPGTHQRSTHVRTYVSVLLCGFLRLRAFFVRRQENDLDPSVNSLAFPCIVGGRRLIFTIPCAGKAFSSNTHLILEKMHNSESSSCRKFPIGRVYIFEAATDGVVIGMSFDLDALALYLDKLGTYTTQNLDPCSL